MPFWSRCLPSVTDDGLEYNLKTCIPERLANEVGHSHYTSLNRGEKGKPWLRIPNTSVDAKWFILLPHVLGPKYERLQRPRNSKGFRIGKSQGNLSNDIRRGQQSPPWIRFLGPVGDCGSAKYTLQRSKDRGERIVADRQLSYATQQYAAQFSPLPNAWPFLIW
jgi:hypothetical protein